MISKAISHYHILSKLGAGGMGEVYLAEDTTLDRRVALELLPLESVDSSPATWCWSRTSGDWHHYRLGKHLDNALGL